MSTWGENTKQFLELTPDRILKALEVNGILCTGRLLQLNSMENRVYQVEVELDEKKVLSSKYEAYRIIKFYRPGRWTKEQILDEHRFLLDLKENELPVVAPMRLLSGETLGHLKNSDLFYCIYPRVGGRIPDELLDDQVALIGRYLARFHLCGEKRQARCRVTIGTQSYGLDHLKYLIDHHVIPMDLVKRYQDIVESICHHTESWFRETSHQRIHGDCHLGNLLWSSNGPFWVDFDDMLNGPVVQDLWLLLPGQDPYSKKQFKKMLEAYQTIRQFDQKSLRLIEPLRALRYIHFSVWIHKRYEDMSFQRAFPDFGTWSYWQQQVLDLELQKKIILSQ